MRARVKGDGLDCWVWLKDNLGAYFLRSAYKWLCLSYLSGSEAFFGKLWSVGYL